MPNLKEEEIEVYMWLTGNCSRFNLLQFLNIEETGKEAARPASLPEFFVYVNVLFQDYNYQ